MEVELSHQIYPRIKVSFIILLFLMLMVLFILVSINIFGMAFRKLGFPPEYSVYFLFLSLLGSYVNLPVKKVRSRVPIMSSKISDFLRSGYAASSLKAERSTIAVNLGGAVIPVVMSVFLSTLVSLVDVLIGVLIVTILIHKIAKPVKGVGIGVVPIIVPRMQLYKLYYILLYLGDLFFQSYSIKSYVQTK